MGLRAVAVSPSTVSAANIPLSPFPNNIFKTSLNLYVMYCPFSSVIYFASVFLKNIAYMQFKAISSLKTPDLVHFTVFYS